MLKVSRKPDTALLQKRLNSLQTPDTPTIPYLLLLEEPPFLQLSSSNQTVDLGHKLFINFIQKQKLLEKLTKAALKDNSKKHYYKTIHRFLIKKNKSKIAYKQLF